MKHKWLVAILSLVMSLVLGCAAVACNETSENPGGGNEGEGGGSHTHAYTQWEHDGNQHWKVCPDDGAVDPAGKTNHDFTNGDCECGAKKPAEGHTHSYTQWEKDENQHWKVCPDDGEMDPAGKTNHDFTNGDCECGQKKPGGGEVTPDADLDTRVFYVVGSGAGDLKNCSFSELLPAFQLTKQPKKDENGYTVYTTSALTLYAGDTMKIVQDLMWDEGLGYFSVGDIKNNDGSLVDGGGPGNITPAKGKDGKYVFTVRTKPDIAFSECTLEAELVESVEPLQSTEEIYIVGNLKYYSTKWPGPGKDVSNSLKLNYDEASGEWSITLRLGGTGKYIYSPSDEFKLYNAVSGKYYPDGTGNNWTVGGSTDGEHHKASGDYKISWKTGDTDVTFTKLEHTHVFDDIRKDDTQHWTMCWLGDEEKADSREDHIWENDQDEQCDTCGQTRHVHKYTEQKYDATQHWMTCPVDGEISPEGKTDHVYDQADGTKCACGAERSDDCAHDGKIVFDYVGDTLPEGVENGGTVQGRCEKCGNPIDVPYDKYLEFAGSVQIDDPLAPEVIENDKTYYGKVTCTKNSSFNGAFLGYEIKEAGTFTLTMDVICSWQKGVAGTQDFMLQYMAIVDTPLETGLDLTGIMNDVVTSHKWNTGSKKAKAEQWKSKITFDPELGSAFRSVTFNFTAEDVGQNVYILITTNINTVLTNSAFLFETSFTPAPVEEHTHTYDAWDHDDTQHWKYCDEHGDDKTNIDEETRADHDFTNGDCECGAKKPVEEHTHTYDAWDYDDTQHWKYCDEHGDDKTNIDEETRADHDFTNGDCECGAKKPQEELDERSYFLVGSGQGTIKASNWALGTSAPASCTFTRVEGTNTYKLENFELMVGDTMKLGFANTWGATQSDSKYAFGAYFFSKHSGGVFESSSAWDDNAKVANGKSGKYNITLVTKGANTNTTAKADAQIVSFTFELIESYEVTTEDMGWYLTGGMNGWNSTAPNENYKLTETAPGSGIWEGTFTFNSAYEMKAIHFTKTTNKGKVTYASEWSGDSNHKTPKGTFKMTYNKKTDKLSHAEVPAAPAALLPKKEEN